MDHFPVFDWRTFLKCFFFFLFVFFFLKEIPELHWQSCCLGAESYRVWCPQILSIVACQQCQCLCNTRLVKASDTSAFILIYTAFICALLSWIYICEVLLLASDLNWKQLGRWSLQLSFQWCRRFYFLLCFPCLYCWLLVFKQPAPDLFFKSSSLFTWAVTYLMSTNVSQVLWLHSGLRCCFY